ncbi:bifunctional DNA primase/polymerase [Streptomyces sp. NPDC050560]|uniref:bifunctional DNA primase/polymerase n=1 Tax=Streptomyces sp. NPDC050560 TaxID=3365630 RepID=UPI0037A28AA2
MRLPAAAVPNAQGRGGPDAAALPRSGAADMAEAAAGYVRRWHWDVLPGTRLEMVDGVPRCSCGVAHCPAPGAHPVAGDWPTLVTGSASGARRLWAERPGASVLLPTGRTFDVLDVPEDAGLLALARLDRMGIALGPVLHTPTGRTQFLVLPGTGARLRTPARPPRPRAAGGGPSPRRGLVVRGEGGWVAAPPTRVGGRGVVQWALPPSAAAHWLPDAEHIAPTLRYACPR